MIEYPSEFFKVEVIMSQEVKENKMGVLPEGRLLLSMSLPMMVSMLVQALYNIADSMFVSRIQDNKAAFNAVSLAFPLQTLLIAIAAGTGVGVNALISRALGEKNQKRVNAVAANGVFVYFVSYVVVAILGFIVVRPFYNWQTGNQIVVELGVSYLTIVMVASFGIFGQFIFERMLQATGRTFFTMISQGIGAIINIILDPLLIFGVGIFPELGIKGAAYATVFGQIVAAFIAFIYNQKKNPDISLSFKGFKPDGGIIGEIYIIGVPSIIMQSIGSIMTAGMNRILGQFSEDAVNVFAAYFKLQSFFFMPVFGLNNGIIPIVSYNYGAKKKKRMINTMKFGYLIAFIFTTIGFALFMIIPDKLLLMVFDATPGMLEIGVPALRIIAVHYLIAWYCIVTGTLFQAVGSAIYSMLVSIARQLVVLLPVAYILSKIGGVSLIWWCFPIAELMSLAITTVCLFLVKKKKLDQI